MIKIHNFSMKCFVCDKQITTRDRNSVIKSFNCECDYTFLMLSLDDNRALNSPPGSIIPITNEFSIDAIYYENNGYRYAENEVLLYNIEDLKTIKPFADWEDAISDMRKNFKRRHLSVVKN